MKMREREGKEGRLLRGSRFIRWRQSPWPIAPFGNNAARTRGLKSDKMHRLGQDRTELHACENVGHGKPVRELVTTIVATSSYLKAAD